MFAVDATFRLSVAYSSGVSVRFRKKMNIYR